MLNEQGFNLWADGYDRSVGLSDRGKHVSVRRDISAC